MARGLHSEDKTFLVVLAIALFLILIGMRAALIGFAGSPAPYMDEWDGDWGALIKPYLDGTLTTSALTEPFMEHRILFTRLLVLGLFNLAGHWDVLLQMIVNAILGSTLIVLGAFALARALSGAFAITAIVAVSLINIVPFAFDNILLGFNTHFYLLPAFSLVALWLAVGARAWSGRWAAGALFGFASFFCMASGALTLAALAATHLAQMACGRRRGLSEAFGVAALIAATALMLVFVPHVPDSDSFRARSPGEFLRALKTLAEWPAGGAGGWLAPIPSLLFGVKIFADRSDCKDPRWFNLAALAWVGAQMAALAAGRAQAVPQSRYCDTLILALAIHFVALLWLLETRAFRGLGAKAPMVALAVWIAVLGVTLPRAERHLPRQIEAWRERVESGGEYVRFYLATGDKTLLAGRQAPYPDSAKLAAYLDAPEARLALPPQLIGAAPPRNGVEAGKRLFLRSAPAAIGLGAGVLLIALFWRWSRAEEERLGHAQTKRTIDPRSWELVG